MKRIISAFLLLTLLTNPAYGLISPSYPVTLQNGTTADASQVMSDFYQIQNDVNTFAAHNGANSDITSLTGLTTTLALQYGGTPMYVGGTSGGSGNAQTLLVVSPTSFTLTAGSMVTGIAGFSNSGAMTLAVNGLTAKAVDYNTSSGLAAVYSGAIIANNPYLFYYDGTQFEVLNPTTATISSVANGGTGAATLTANSILQGNGTSAITSIAPGASGNVLTSNGTAFASAALPVGSSSVTGVVKVDNTTITASAGVISATPQIMTALGVGSIIIGQHSSGAVAAGTSYPSTDVVAGTINSAGAFQPSLDTIAGNWQALTSSINGNQALLFQRISYNFEEVRFYG